LHTDRVTSVPQGYAAAIAAELVEANGFRLISTRDLVPKSQYIAIFVKK
jgi:hypothetical protein